MCLWSIGPHQHRHHLPGPEHGRRSSAQGQGRRPRQPACAEGISAVKALALAQAQGQRIYTITPSNAATALPKLPVGGEVGAEIRNAIQAGKEVTIHENPITAHGWTGYGYIIVDPETGAGAYLIEGKGNGGYFAIQGANLAAIGFLGLLYASVTTAVLAPAFPMIAALALSIGIHILILELAFNSDVKWSDVKGDILLAVTGALGPLGAESKLGALLVSVVGFIAGYESNR